MPRFKVRLYNRGEWNQEEPREVEAADAREAAAITCGDGLTDQGKLGQLRAEVWPAANPRNKSLFYVHG